MPRPYRSSAPEQRYAERRRRLIDAGIELVGSGGVAALTMRAVCRQAQLSQKFFYESFTDTDDLLGEVYRTTFQRALAIIKGGNGGAGQTGAPDGTIRSSVDAAAKLAKDDPRVCRILLVEPVADLRLRHFVRSTIAGMDFSLTVDPPDDSDQGKMHYATLFGAIISLFLEWTEGNLGDDRAAFVDHVTAMVLASPLATAAAESEP